jgi:hypothetical protein
MVNFFIQFRNEIKNKIRAKKSKLHKELLISQDPFQNIEAPVFEEILDVSNQKDVWVLDHKIKNFSLQNEAYRGFTMVQKIHFWL